MPPGNTRPCGPGSPPGDPNYAGWAGGVNGKRSLRLPVLEDVAQDFLRAGLAVAVLDLHAGEGALDVLLLGARDGRPVLGPVAEDLLLDLGDGALALLVVGSLERLEDVAEELLVGDRLARVLDRPAGDA